MVPRNWSHCSKLILKPWRGVSANFMELFALKSFGNKSILEPWRGVIADFWSFLHPEMQKAADLADISVLFFLSWC